MSEKRNAPAIRYQKIQVKSLKILYCDTYSLSKREKVAKKNVCTQYIFVNAWQWTSASFMWITYSHVGDGNIATIWYTASIVHMSIYCVHYSLLRYHFSFLFYFIFFFIRRLVHYIFFPLNTIESFPNERKKK